MSSNTAAVQALIDAKKKVNVFTSLSSGTASKISVPTGTKLIIDPATYNATTVHDLSLLFLVAKAFRYGANESPLFEVVGLETIATGTPATYAKAAPQTAVQAEAYAAIDGLNSTSDSVMEMSEAFSEFKAGAKSKALNAQNIKSWVKSHDFPDWMTAMMQTIKVDVAASGFPIPTKLTKWLDYRVGKQSTSSLCNKAIASIKGNEKFIFTEEELELISLSSHFLEESHIPSLTVAKCYIILQFAKIDFGDWYQGNEALQYLTITQKMNLQAALKASQEASKDNILLQSARTPEEAFAAAGTTKEGDTLRDGIKSRIAKNKVSSIAHAIAKDKKKPLIDLEDGVGVPEVVKYIKENAAAVKDLEQAFS